MTALQQLSARAGYQDIARLLWRMRNESMFVTLSTADMLVCATYGPQLWRTNPELAQALEWLDENEGPYCPDCWAALPKNRGRCRCRKAAA